MVAKGWRKGLNTQKNEDDFLGDEAVIYLNCGSDYATVKSYRNAY